MFDQQHIQLFLFFLGAVAVVIVFIGFVGGIFSRRIDGIVGFVLDLGLAALLTYGLTTFGIGWFGPHAARIEAALCDAGFGAFCPGQFSKENPVSVTEPPTTSTTTTTTTTTAPADTSTASGGAAPPVADERGSSVESGLPSSPPPPPAPPPVSATTSAEVPAADANVLAVKDLLYATNRKAIPAGTNKIVYGTTRGNLRYGTVKVSIPLAHKRGQIETPTIIRIGPLTIYEERQDPAKHFILMTPQELTLDGFKSKIAASPRRRALIYIHGFKTSFEDAALTTAQISYDVKFDGLAIFFSWPSLNQLDPRAYVTDEDQANAAAPALESVLKTVRSAVGPTGEIYLIAHSMGNVPLVEYLYHTAQAAVPNSIADEIIFAAPDVDKDLFLSRIESLTQSHEHMTLYASSNDKALYASSNFLRIGAPPRAGFVQDGEPVLIEPGIDTIDVSALSTDFFDLAHGTYAQNSVLLGDIEALIGSRAYRAPHVRTSRIKQVTVQSGRYWVVP